MKPNRKHTPLLLAFLSALSFQLSAFPQTTAFTYQGRLNDGGSPANGSYQFLFWVDDGNNAIVGTSITPPPVGVTNGLFTVTLDFGPGIFTGGNRRLHLEVRTNDNTSMFVALSPPQPILPTPYAIYAETVDAAGIIGVVPSAAAAGTATNLYGPLLGDVTGTQGATVVSTVGGQSAANVATGVSAANAATSANMPNTIVKRDGTGSFAAGTVKLDGTLNLPAPAATIYSGGSTLLRSDGNHNLFTGSAAGNLTTTGNGNTAHGFQALHSNTTGGKNAALGTYALYGNTEGNGNTASGNQALQSNSTGSQNTASGNEALLKNTTGSDNTGSGFEVLNSNTTGSNNTAHGSSALHENTTGSRNTASGYQALDSNVNGAHNSAHGAQALFSNTSGNYNTAGGSSALQANTTGDGNTANGFSALVNNTGGAYNTANGLQSLAFNGSGSYNTASGVQALFNNNGSNNTAHGFQALFANTTGSNNIALGHRAGSNLTTGDNNIAIGNAGVAAESGTTRIGTPGTHTNTFVAGIAGANVGAGSVVLVNSSGQLGSVDTIPLSQMPVEVVAPPPGMVLIPAGSYTMGNSVGDDDLWYPAAPVTVNVSAFYMDVNLVSYSQWQSVYFWALGHGYEFFYNGSGKAANHPVHSLSWYDCVRWCNMRSEQAGKTPMYYTDAGLTQVFRYNMETTIYTKWTANGYRLPTEAEWEKAARGGLSGERFPWGAPITDHLANYNGQYYGYDLAPVGHNAAVAYGGLPYTSPIGYFAPNGYGLYDMAGNLFQWCWDWYAPTYAGGSDPHGPAEGSPSDFPHRIVRGGSWDSYFSFLRCASRIPSRPDATDHYTGFRCVRGL